MKLDNDDIEAAVAAGVISQIQADNLRAFSAQRRAAPLSPASQEDESFRFMTGFNDFFFAIGILMLGSGVAYFAINSQSQQWASLFAAALMWALSELLVRRMRLVLPGILLSVFFVIFIYLAVPPDLIGSSVPRFPLANPVANTLLGLTGAPKVTAAKALIGMLAAGLFYWRFRLPFTLLLIAASLVAGAGALVEMAAGQLPPTLGSLFGLSCGLAVFVVAMRYDMSDRERVTRRSDCAFWLHLLAAPLIVHSLISLLTTNIRQIDNVTASAIIAIVAVLALVAIVIDRRALLVSALIYVGSVIAYALGGSSVWNSPLAANRTFVFFVTLLILGVFVIVLGVGWMPLRRRLLNLISPSIAARVPPASIGA